MLISSVSFAGNIVVKGDSTKQEQAKSIYPLSDPRNPDCPCHKLQQKAEDEYKKLQKRERYDPVQVVNRVVEPQMELIAQIKLDEIVYHPQNKVPDTLLANNINSYTFGGNGSSTIIVGTKRKHRSNFMIKARKKWDSIFSRSDKYKQKHYKCFDW